MLFRLKRNGAAKNSGFTVIEVMIVLAIGGLILSIVLLGVPALKRSVRNHARKSYAFLVLADINEFRTNIGGGRVPACDDDDDPSVCTTARTNAINLLTPGFGLSSVDDTSIPSVIDVTTSFCHGVSNPAKTVVYCWDDRDPPMFISHTYIPPVGQIMIAPKHLCGTNTGTGPYGDRILTDPGGDATSGNIKDDVAVIIGIEGGNGYYCVSNSKL